MSAADDVLCGSKCVNCGDAASVVAAAVRIRFEQALSRKVSVQDLSVFSFLELRRSCDGFRDFSFYVLWGKDSTGYLCTVG